MTFVDTNYILRFLLHDIEEQYNQAKQLFKEAARDEVTLITSTLVFFEIHWVLKGTYGKNREKIAIKLEKFLSLSITIEEQSLLFETVSLFKTKNLSLEDCYNLCFAKSKKVQDFQTFDQKLKKAFNN